MASSEATEKYIDILLVGKTGSGKSATGNTILRKKAFEYSNSTTSLTKDLNYDFSKFEGTNLKVVDSPGLGDTDMDEIDGLELVIKAMTKAISANPEGYHAVLVVVRYGGRYTREEIQTISQLKRIFGDNFIKQHAILVMTCGDFFTKGNSNQSFEEWCMEQTGGFADLYKECMQRVILFDNKLEEKKLRDDQIRRLLTMINNLTTHGGRYTNENFAQAKEERSRLLASKPSVHEKVLREFSVIIDNLKKIKFKNIEIEGVKLEMLKSRLASLEKEIIQEDRGTNSLSSAKKFVEGMISTVDKYLKNLEEPKKINKLEEEIKLLKEEEEDYKRDLKAKEKLRKEQEKNRKKEAKQNSKAENKDKQAREYTATKSGESREEKGRKSVVSTAYPEEARRRVGDTKDEIWMVTKEGAVSPPTGKLVDETTWIRATESLNMDENEPGSYVKEAENGHIRVKRLSSDQKRRSHTERTRLMEEKQQMTKELKHKVDMIRSEQTKDVKTLEKDYKAIKSQESKPVLKSVAKVIKKPIWNLFKLSK